MRPLFFLSLFLAWCPSVAQRYNIWKHFNSNNGLPQNSVVNLLADTAGYVWIATEGGLVRYDGGSIRVFELKAQGSLPAKRIRGLVATTLGEVLVEDANGNIYEIHGHIAPVFRAGSRQVADIKGGVPSAEVYLRNAKPRSAYNMPIYHWPARYPFSSTEQVVVGMDSLWRWNDTLMVEKLAIERPLQRAFFLGKIAFGIDNNGFVVRVDTRTGATTPVHVNAAFAPGLEWPEVFWSLEQKEGFLVTERGLFGVTTNSGADTLTLAPYDAQLPTAGSITSVMRVPGTDVLLIGTSTSGLFALRPDPLQAVDHSSPTGANGAVFAQALLPNGDVLFVRNGQGYRVGPSGTSVIKELTGASSFILPTDHQGHIWSWHHHRLSRFDPNTWQEQVIIPKIERGLALRSVGDSVLISDGNSIKVWRNGHIHELAKLSSSTYLDWPSTMYVDDQARLWYGADRGLFRRNKTDGSFQAIKGLENKDIRSITQVQDLLLASTYGNGWYIVIGDSALRMPNDPMNCMDYAHTFLLQDDILWSTTNRGLIRLLMEDLRTYLADGTQRPYMARYGTAHGVLNLEFNGGCEPPLLRLKDGTVSCPTIEGIVRFDPSNIPDPYPQRELVQGHVRVDNEKWSVNRYLIFDNDVVDIEFDLSLPYWGDQENAQLEYWIQGVQTSWQVLPIGERTIRVTRPPPGDHHVIVRRVGSAARGIPHQPLYGFRVERPFWATFPAYLLYAVTILLLTWVVTKLNTVRLRRRNKWLEENVATQTEALMQANLELRGAVSHQEKLISVISHDVVPPLRFVARVAQSAERILQEGRPGNDLAETLADLSTSTKKLYNNAESLLTWIRTRNERPRPSPRNIDLRGVVEASIHRVQEMFEQSGITTHNHVTCGALAFVDEDLIAIVIHNALMNVHAHAAATMVEFHADQDANNVRLTITDNGKGMTPNILARLENEINGSSQLDDPERKGPATGLGFVIIAECLRQMGSHLVITSSGLGTSLCITLPRRTGPELQGTRS